jgi:hypothetical protein
LLPAGVAVGLVGFVALAVEAVRVALGGASLSSWQNVVPWVGLGLIVVAAVLLLAALLGETDATDATDATD